MEIADVTLDSTDTCGEFWDEYTGERLPSEEVARARADEIDGLRQYGAYERSQRRNAGKQRARN